MSTHHEERQVISIIQHIHKTHGDIEEKSDDDRKAELEQDVLKQEEKKQEEDDVLDKDHPTE